ncbi:hypothetical protein Tco_1151525 [Tanacetum coccineum]
MTTKDQQSGLDNALVAPENQRVIGKEIPNICPRIPGQEFYEPPTKEEALSFIRELGHSGEIKYITDVIVDPLHQPWRTFASIINKCLCGKIDKKDSKKQDKMFYPRFTKIIIHHFLKKDKYISLRNKMFMHTAGDDNLLAISSEESPSKKKLASKPQPPKKKAPINATRGKGLNVLSEVALFEAAQLKEATKRSKKDFHISHASGFGIDEGTGTKPGVLDVPKYDSESEQESWGNSNEEDDDDEDESKDERNDDKGNDDNDGDNDDNDDDDYNNDHDDMNYDDKTDSERNEVHTPKLTDEDDNDEEKMDEKEDDEVTKELYNDVNVNFGNEDADMTYVDQGGEDLHNKTEGTMQSSSVSSNFTSKLLNLKNVSPTNNVIASLMDTNVHHEETSNQASSHIIPITAIPEVTSTFTTTIPPPPPFFNPLLQQATPTLTPTAPKATNLFLALPDFSSVFKFNDIVTNLEKDMSEMKRVNQYAQDLSSIPAIIDRYIDNKLGEAIKKAIQSHTAECREEALADKREYIDLINTLVRTIIRKEVKTQLPLILPKAVSDFVTPMIKGNVIDLLEAAVLAKSSAQPKSTYAAAALLSKFELTKILMEKMEENKSHLSDDYKSDLYDALVKSYNTNKDLFDTYGELFTLKRSQGDNDKDQDPSAGSDRGIKRWNSSKEAESFKDPRSKEKENKSLASFKGTSRSQHKPSGKSAHAEEPRQTVDDLGVRQNQEFDMGNNDEQPDDEATPKVNWFKEPKRPTTLDPD